MKTFSRSRAILATVASVAPAALGILGCAGENPGLILRETFDSGRAVSSGELSLELAVTSEGGPRAGNASLRMRGPFEGRDGAPTALDMAVAIAADMGRRDVDFEGRLLTGGGKGFVGVGGTAYELPPRTYRRLQRLLGGAGADAPDGRSDLLGRLGIDPRDWLQDLRYEGEQRVGGEEVSVVSGSADVPRMVRDLSRTSRTVREATRALGEGGIADLGRSLRSAEFTVLSGAEDRLLRGLRGRLELREEERPDRALTVVLDVRISEPNEPQRIQPPRRSVPLESLLSRLGVSVEELERALSGAPRGAGSGDSYRSCLRGAANANEVRECASLLGT